MIEGLGSRCAEASESGADTAPKLVLVYAGTGPQALQLSMKEESGRMVISWPMQDADGYRLQFAPSLTETNWITVGDQGFFRLVK